MGIFLPFSKYILSLRALPLPIPKQKTNIKPCLFLGAFPGIGSLTHTKMILKVPLHTYTLFYVQKLRIARLFYIFLQYTIQKLCFKIVRVSMHSVKFIFIASHSLVKVKAVSTRGLIDY